jgi:hypothetical protein
VTADTVDALMALDPRISPYTPDVLTRSPLNVPVEALMALDPRISPYMPDVATTFVDFVFPATSRVAVGALVPIPTLPPMYAMLLLFGSLNHLSPLMNLRFLILRGAATPASW